jgi:hypothetical protein
MDGLANLQELLIGEDIAFGIVTGIARYKTSNW